MVSIISNNNAQTPQNTILGFSFGEDRKEGANELCIVPSTLKEIGQIMSVNWPGIKNKQAVAVANTLTVSTVRVFLFDGL
jgi:hypothetical protein